MRKAPWFLLAMSCLLSAADSASAQVSAGWRLRPGDQLRVQIKNEPDLSGLFLVGPDGAILLPVIGTLDAVADPFTSLESAIRSRFAIELADPEMILTPLQRVSVTGEVRLPGFQWVDTTSTVADLMVLAGGTLPTANRRKVTLMRDDREIRVMLRDGGVFDPLPLRSGDRLMVGRRSWFAENLPIFIGAAASVAAAAVTSVIVR